MAGEDVVHLHVHLLLLVEEAPGGVRDRLEVVGDLVDHDRLDADLDPLRRDAVEVELGLVDVEREMTHLLEERQVERALADDDLEAEPRRVTLGAAMRVHAGDDQSLVGLRDLVQEHVSLPLSASSGSQ